MQDDELDHESGGWLQQPHRYQERLGMRAICDLTIRYEAGDESACLAKWLIGTASHASYIAPVKTIRGMSVWPGFAAAVPACVWVQPFLFILPHTDLLDHGDSWFTRLMEKRKGPGSVLDRRCSAWPLGRAAPRRHSEAPHPPDSLLP